ncbi:MAG: class I SAM-dependent methyltransferase [Planctomycetes bacterium]|nr:class I SAM-dependent methyltransferase [Planctomycetota bacterium]
MTSTSDPKGLGSRVKSFYEVMPFNLHGTADDAIGSIRAHSLANTYPDLHRLLASGAVDTVLEIGCGAGWLCNTLAHHYGVTVTAVDFTAAALERARAVAAALGTSGRIRFVESDLFDYEHEGTVDLVLSIGVLHHTRDCEAAFKHVQRFAGPGKQVYIGLYHEPGRRPFLELFRGLLESKGEEAAFAHYRRLDGIHAADETMARSWFRDQVLHPHETQHTLRELAGWFRDTGFELESTSVNRFEPVADVEALFALEQTFDERSRRANVDEGRYFPGFFTGLGRRTVTARR